MDLLNIASSLFDREADLDSEYGRGVIDLCTRALGMHDEHTDVVRAEIARRLRN